MEVQKGVCELPKARNIANDILKQNMAKFGYYPATVTYCLL